MKASSENYAEQIYGPQQEVQLLLHLVYFDCACVCIDILTIGVMGLYRPVIKTAKSSEIGYHGL